MLVVDDNQTNRLVLASQLRAWDLACDTAADGEAALEALRAAAETTPYDLAVLDMAMPGMNGFGLAAAMRADPALVNVHLVLLSSVSVETESAVSVGFAANLTKPVRHSALYDALARALAPSSLSTPSGLPARATVAVGSQGTLLIVEDHAINQAVAKGILAKLGYESDVAADGIEALAAVARRTYDAVLMDCHMPRMDGFEATAEIRRLETDGRHLPIIAMTAMAMVDDREKCIAAGMDDYLSKPVNVHALGAVLHRWIIEVQPNTEHEDIGGGNGPGDGEGVIDGRQFDVLVQLAATSDDPDLLESLVDRYLEQAASQLEQLRSATARGDATALMETAHSLKGASATMGASGVASATQSLEEAAARGETADSAGLERVALELSRATHALRARLPKSPA